MYEIPRMTNVPLIYCTQSPAVNAASMAGHVPRGLQLPASLLGAAAAEAVLLGTPQRIGP